MLAVEPSSKSRLKAIENCLQYTSYCDDNYYNSGIIFGSYVHDIVIPGRIGMDVTCNTCIDVNIWFTKQKYADTFIETNNMHSSNTLIRLIYKERQGYCLVLNHTYVAFFNIIISETFPDDDFDINFICYRCRDFFGNNSYIFHWPNTTNLSNDNIMIKSIINKEAKISHNYVDKLSKTDYNWEIYRERINKQFLDNGWTIKYGDITFPKHLSKNRTDFMKLILGSKSSIEVTETLPKEDIKSLLDLLKEGDTRCKEADIRYKEAIKERNEHFINFVKQSDITDENLISDLIKTIIQHNK